MFDSRRATLGVLLFWPVLALAQIVIPAGGALSVPAGGAIDTGCAEVSILGTVNVGDGHLRQSGTINIGSGGALSAGAGTITLSGSWNNAGTFNPGTGSVVFTDGCIATPIQLSGQTTFNNLTLSSSTGRTFILPAGQNITVTGTLTLQGAPGQPIQVLSSSGQTARVTLGPGAQVVSSNAAVSGGVQIGNALASPQAIPTLSEYGILLLTLLLSVLAMRQRLPHRLRGDTPGVH